MNAHWIRIAAVLATLATWGVAEAQQVNPAGVVPRQRVLHNVYPGYHPYPVYGFCPRVIYRAKAATVGESWARGRAALIHAQANYNMTMAHVRAMETETRQRRLEYYYANKETNKQYRDSLRKPRPASEDLARFAQAAKPDELSPRELDLKTGELSWPVLLESADFAGHRAELERLFAQVAADGDFDAAEHDRLARTTDAMLAELEGLVRDVKPMDYVEAKRFIESLACQSRQQKG